MMSYKNETRLLEAIDKAINSSTALEEEDYRAGLHKARQIICQEENASVVRPVRCYKCKYSEYNIREDGSLYPSRSMNYWKHRMMVFPFCFCSWGEPDPAKKDDRVL
jgi:hypothetical protein